MQPEILEMGKDHPDWGKKYDSVSKQMDNQAAELRFLYRKVLMMRYETTILGLKYLKTKKRLQQLKEESEALESLVGLQNQQDETSM